MPTQVNLDALIPREDFEILDTSVQFTKTQTIAIRELEDEAFFYHTLRKPDFQRETADWTPPKVKDFIVSFINGDLIPAIILWNSGSHIFVIDGAHRLSALIAWVSDDYGDGPISQAFFDQKIPQDQISVAHATRQLINKAIGSYKSHKYVIQHPENASPKLLESARRLASLALQVQWVSGDADKAEDSFFRINQQAVAINSTELNLLKARRMPTALAARAIMHSGTGHRYWSKFNEEKKKQIEELSSEIYNLLFTPALRTPVKTLDLPVAGRGYSAQTLQLVFDFINIINEEKVEQEDDTGEETINLLKHARRVVNRMTGDHPSSLGLHPAVYFYGVNGRYQPTAFLAFVALLDTWERISDSFNMFTKHREKFEAFLLEHKDLANQVATIIGSGTRGMPRLRIIYQTIIDGLLNGTKENEILTPLLSDKRFHFLKIEGTKQDYIGADFDTDTKSEIFLREALKGAVKCGICSGLVHVNSISMDHKKRKEEGGKGESQNGQLTHPYCNTTYKH